MKLLRRMYRALDDMVVYTSTILILSMKDFYRDGGMMLAGSLSYFFIISIVPLSLFVLGVLSYVMGANQDFLTFFIERFLGMFPKVTRGVTGEMQKLIQFKGLARASFVLYAILAYQFYAAIHKAMETALKVDEKRSVWGMFIFPVLVVTLVVVIMFTSFALTTSIPIIEKMNEYVEYINNLLPFVDLAVIDLSAVHAFLIRYIIPLVMVQFTMITVYMIVPKRRVYFEDAFWGALFTAVMLEAAKHFFTWYVSNVIRLGTVYGSLSTFMTFLFWVYYSSAIFLVGAEIVHNHSLRRGPPLPPGQ